MADVLSGLGCRIGELLALDWPRIDDVAGTIAIEGTVIRVPKQGLIVQKHTKSDASMRTITPPSWVIAVLRTRHVTLHGPWVFPSSRGTLRDPDTTRGQLRKTVKGTGWEGLHPHAFRHLVATPRRATPRRGTPLGARDRRPPRSRRALDDPGRLHVPQDRRYCSRSGAPRIQTGPMRWVSVRSIFLVDPIGGVVAGEAPPAGLEPATLALEGPCSVRLSYGGLGAD